MGIHILALFIGFLLDLLLGDPIYRFHPIRLIGNLIYYTEKILRNLLPNTKKFEFIGGGILVVFVILISTLFPFILLKLAESINFYLKFTLEIIMCYQLLATKSLKTESMKVYFQLKSADIIKARQAVSMIIGRDTANLSFEGIAKATVETIAENTSDGVIAPILFIAIGGPIGGFFYKAVNTMDSMIGYKNDNYLYFGKIAAKLDDILNFIPARISAFLMILGSYFLRFDWQNAYFIYKRDRYNHTSPNSAHTEAVCAGALRIQLAGDAFYFGRLYPKKTIGNLDRKINPEDIKATIKLLYITAFLCIFLILFISLVISFIKDWR